VLRKVGSGSGKIIGEFNDHLVKIAFHDSW
jgi:hypothetical protein